MSPMAEFRELSMIFKTLQDDTVPSLGINDRLYGRIIASRLLIERLGEKDANYWWDSQILGGFGHDALAEAVPRTTTRVQIELATKTGRKVEQEKIEDRSISLFNLGPFVESQIDHELEQVDDDVDLNILKDYSAELTDKGWTDSIVSEADPIASESGTTIELGAVAVDDMNDRAVLRDVVGQLVHGYGKSTANNLQIPYFRVDQ